jgi:hypothetical protein
MEGLPLTREADLPSASMASTDWMVALKETTLATGASVPMTNAEPVEPLELLEDWFMLSPQPMSRKTERSRGAALRQRVEMRERREAWVDMREQSLSAVPEADRVMRGR